MKRYYTLLDFLRFFAAFWVMGFHYFLWWSKDLTWYRYGNLGVPLFFIVSGFVISQSVAHGSLKRFALGRFIRLFPLFWILCTFTYIFTLLIPNGNPVSIQEYLISMTMLGEKLGNIFGYLRLVDAAYWSLVIELIFYVAIGLFVYLFSWKNIRAFTLGWFLISLSSFIFGFENTFIAKTLLVRHASYFLFGITLAIIVSTNYTSIRQKLYDYGFLVMIAMYSTYISYRALPPYLSPNPADTSFVMWLHPMFFIIVLTLVYFSRYAQSSTWLSVSAVVGGITYPLYLIHQTVGNTLIQYFASYGTLAQRGGVMMALAIGLSYIAYIYDKKLRKTLSLKLLPRKEVSEK